MVLVSCIFPVVTLGIIFVLVPFQYFYGICCADLDILAHPCLYSDDPIELSTIVSTDIIGFSISEILMLKMLTINSMNF